MLISIVQQNWDYSAWRREGSGMGEGVCNLGGGYYQHILTPAGRVKKDKGVQWQRERQWAQADTQKVPSESQGTPLYCAAVWVFVQVAQRSWGSKGLGQVPFGGHAWAGVWPEDIQMSLSTSATLWFCDSVICMLLLIYTLYVTPKVKLPIYFRGNTVATKSTIAQLDKAVKHFFQHSHHH